MTATGQLNERLAFDTPTRVGDGYGGTTDGWSEEFTIAARRLFLRGSETIQAARLEGRQPVIFTVRASSDTRRITTDWRARDVRAGTQYQLRSVEPNENRSFIDLLCERGVAI